MMGRVDDSIVHYHTIVRHGSGEIVSVSVLRRCSAHRILQCPFLSNQKSKTQDFGFALLAW
jgi:hypothetical protein